MTYNKLCSNLEPSYDIKPQTKTRIKTVLKNQGEETLLYVFRKANRCEFLTRDKHWDCDLDWIFAKDHFEKIARGNYDEEYRKLDPEFLQSLEN